MDIYTEKNYDGAIDNLRNLELIKKSIIQLKVRKHARSAGLLLS